jgi:hypothetical protein
MQKFKIFIACVSTLANIHNSLFHSLQITYVHTAPMEGVCNTVPAVLVEPDQDNGLDHETVQAATMVLASMSQRNFPPFLGAREQVSKDAVIYVVNHVPIACNSEQHEAMGGGSVCVPLTVVRVHKRGFSKVPYKKNKVFDTTLPLFDLEIARDESSSDILHMWSFLKSGSGSKGIRCDDKRFCLQPGDVIKQWISNTTFENMKDDAKTESFLPVTRSTAIPALSLLKINVTSSNHEANDKGYSIRIQNICESEYSLYALLNDVVKLPKSLRDAKEHQQTKIEKYPCMKQDIDGGNVGFFCTPNAALDEVYVSSADVESTGVVTVVNWTTDADELGASGDCRGIDIPVHTLLQYTNSTSVAHACAFLELALSMGAVKGFFTAYNSYAFKKRGEPRPETVRSNFHAVPLIDVERMFQVIPKAFSVDLQLPLLLDSKGQAFIRYDTQHQYNAGGGMQSISLDVYLQESEYKPCEGSESKQLIAASANEMPILCGGKPVKRGIRFDFNLASNATCSPIASIFYGYFNLECSTSGLNDGTQHKRRRLCSLEEM